MKKEIVITNEAPTAIGPYSQAVKINGYLYVSGQIAINPTNGEIVKGEVKNQTVQVLENIKAILDAVGASFENVIKTTVYLTDMGDFTSMNEIYGEYFPNAQPARACVEVSRLPKDVSVEIEAIAFVP